MISILNNKYANMQTAQKLDKSFGSQSNENYNAKNPPFNEHVARIVESNKKFEIKFAEKKKKEGFLQQLIEKEPNFLQERVKMKLPMQEPKKKKKQ